MSFIKTETQLVPITILRTNDAKKYVISMSLGRSLGDLKDEIARSNFGPTAANQRIFHLGRELKTSGRSLSALGFGRHAGVNPVVHMFSRPTTKHLTDDGKGASLKTKEPKRKLKAVSVTQAGRADNEPNGQTQRHRRPRRTLKSEEVCINDDRNCSIVHETSTISRHRILEQAGQHQPKDCIIEILDDDDGNDSDVAVLEGF